MKSIGIILLAGLGFLIGCSSGGGFDPTLFNEGFTGITYTNEDGRIIGPVDPSDWQLTPCNEANIYIFNGLYRKYDSATHIIPNFYAVAAAYPNPSKEEVTIKIALATACQFSLKIIDNSYHIIDSISGYTVGAGIVQLGWDLKDSRGRPLPGGMYRVIYKIDDRDYCRYGYGDILVQ